MPSTTMEVHEAMIEIFGPEYDDFTAWAYLQQRGWREDRGFLDPPKPWTKLSSAEKTCATYLVDEWDYGF